MNWKRVKIYIRQNVLLRTVLFPAIFVNRTFSKNKRHIEDTIFDNLGEVLDRDPVLKLNDFQGVFCIGCHSDLFHRVVRDREYEPLLAEVCTNHIATDKDVIDVGANLGFYSVLSAKTIGSEQRVLAIEPTPNALLKLKKNLELNAIREKVIIFEGVASEENGPVKINTIEGREEYSSLGVMVHPSVVNDDIKSIETKSARVDDLVHAYGLIPGFVKIDVEGMEHVVLKGMIEVLKKFRPVVLSELSRPLLEQNGSSSEGIIHFMEDLGYEVIDPKYPNDKAGSRDFGDILCIPKM